MNSTLEQQIQERYPTIKFNKKPVDLIYLPSPALSTSPLDHIYHNNTMFVFNGIRANKTAYSLWENHINNKDFTVSIDFYSFGVAFKRKEQVKEHFTIRL